MNLAIDSTPIREARLGRNRVLAAASETTDQLTRSRTRPLALLALCRDGSCFDGALDKLIGGDNNDSLFGESSPAVFDALKSGLGSDYCLRDSIDQITSCES